MCKAPVSALIIAANFKDFSEFPLAKLKQNKSLDVYYDSAETHQSCVLFMGYQCPLTECQAICNGWKDLKQHVKTHSLGFCSICTSFKKVFPKEQVLYSAEDLQPHIKPKDGNNDGGHPKCQFCNTLFYGLDELYDHCKKLHEQCFVCQQNGKRFQYYKNYALLEAHFQSDHFYCTDKECLEKKFVVFGTQIDYEAHMVDMYLLLVGGAY